MASGFRLAFFLCLTGVLISETWSFRRVCPYGWRLHGSRCFHVFSRPRTAAIAELICVRFHGNLASIHNFQENNFIRRLVFRKFRSHRRVWIGFNDAIQERIWMWTDGSKVRFTRWRRGEPNNRRNEDCTEMNFRGNFWNDIRCRRRRPYVCARPSRLRRPIRPVRPVRPTRPTHRPGRLLRKRRPKGDPSRKG